MGGVLCGNQKNSASSKIDDFIEQNKAFCCREPDQKNKNISDLIQNENKLLEHKSNIMIE